MATVTITNISEATISAFKNDSQDKLEILRNELLSNSSTLREIVGEHVPDDYDLDDKVEIEGINGSDDDGTIDVKFTFRKYLGDGEDDDHQRSLPVDFEVHIDTYEVSLSCEDGIEAV